jgi:RHS repeat-associated protein
VSPTFQKYFYGGTRLEAIEALDGTQLGSFEYDWNRRITAMIDPAGNRTEKTYNVYGDMLSKTVYRTTDTGLVAQTETYSYDILGNKLSQIDANGNETLYEYNHQNKQTARIDALGNRTEYEYDGRGNQTAIHYPDGTSQTTTYDADDNRISTTDRDGRTTTFAYEANDAEDVTDTYAHDAFGNLLDKAGVTSNNYLYTGEQLDPNAGFYYLRERYYDQSIGRFVTTDPYQGRMHELVTQHKYLYANANPVMFSDPSGRFSTSASVSAGLAITAGLVNLGVRNVLTYSKRRGNILNPLSII